MSRVLFVDPVGGASGDMLLAALLDLGADAHAVLAAWRAVYPERPVDRCLEQVTRNGLLGAHVRPALVGSSESLESVVCTHAELAERIERADAPIRDMAQRVLERLALAEARAHGGSPEARQLQELGTLDTLFDVVGVAAALAVLGVERLFVSALPIAVGGFAESAHGVLPLPAPATLELLRGFAVRGVSGGELVTPTAAAIFAALGETSGEMPPMVIEAVGTGAGKHDPPQRPNLLRAILGRLTSMAMHDGNLESVVLLETNLDDLTPQLLSEAAEALRTAGALEVWTSTSYGKKGRLVLILSALVQPEHVPEVRRAFFETTTTLGVRENHLSRMTLPRRLEAVPVAGGSVQVKRGDLDGVEVTATPEYADVVRLARKTGQTVRSVYDQAKAAAQNDDSAERK